MLFHFGPKAWYFYGMSSNEGRERMPTYLLQWEAIRWAQARGYATYDFWGAPDEFREDAPMWGVYRFKDGFGGTVVRHIGAWTRALARAVRCTSASAARVLAVMRRGGIWLFNNLLPYVALLEDVNVRAMNVRAPQILKAHSKNPLQASLLGNSATDGLRAFIPPPFQGGTAGALFCFRRTKERCRLAPHLDLFTRLVR